jgi:DNA-directed RNA polymerase specialized sigma24 family protein
MSEAKQIAKPAPYASKADFGQIFHEDMKELYLLSFLLTADREKAEQCFVSGLEDAVEGNPVFKEWARSWARRAIIQNAVRVINPWPVEGNGHSRSPSINSASINGDSKAPPSELPAEIAAVLRLEPFERFVYVMTVFEQYSDQECSVLLGCARRDVLAARTRALPQLGSATEMPYRQLPNSRAQNPALHERRSSVLELLDASRLVTSA